MRSMIVEPAILKRKHHALDQTPQRPLITDEYSIPFGIATVFYMQAYHSDKLDYRVSTTVDKTQSLSFPFILPPKDAFFTGRFLWC
jgi:hypothetical protein